MMVIKCFGIARDIIKSDELIVDDISFATVSDLRSYLNGTFKELNKIKSYFIAVNQEYADENLPINRTDEIAIIPPVSGG